MPNWCSNQVTVTGSPEVVAVVVAAVRGTDDDGKECPIDFRRILPPPPDATDEVSWRYDHWGTKWLPVHPNITKNDKGEFIVTFESAWSPPKEFVIALSERFPDVTVELSYDLPEGLRPVPHLRSWQARWRGLLGERRHRRSRALIQT